MLSSKQNIIGFALLNIGGPKFVYGEGNTNMESGFLEITHKGGAVKRVHDGIRKEQEQLRRFREAQAKREAGVVGYAEEGEAPTRRRRLNFNFPSNRLLTLPIDAQNQLSADTLFSDNWIQDGWRINGISSCFEQMFGRINAGKDPIAVWSTKGDRFVNYCVIGFVNEYAGALIRLRLIENRDPLSQELDIFKKRMFKLLSDYFIDKQKLGNTFFIDTTPMKIDDSKPAVDFPNEMILMRCVKYLKNVHWELDAENQVDVFEEDDSKISFCIAQIEELEKKRKWMWSEEHNINTPKWMWNDEAEYKEKFDKFMETYTNKTWGDSFSEYTWQVFGNARAMLPNTKRGFSLF